MTVATVETKTYKTFTWQAVKKMADAMDVKFYSHSARYENDGLGLKAGYSDKTEIRIAGYERAHSDNWYTNSRLNTLSKENFMLKLELWALKNGISYELFEERDFLGNKVLAGFRIVESN
jgi:hypothetical protein